MVWIDIAHAPKDGTSVDLWGTNITEAGSRAMMMPHPKPSRFADCFFGKPERRDIRPSGLHTVETMAEGWYHTVVGLEKTFHIRIWPTHYMLIPKGPGQ